MRRAPDLGLARMFRLIALLPALHACAPLQTLPPARALPQPAGATVEYRHVVQFQADQVDVNSTETIALEKFIATIPIGQMRTTRIVVHADDVGDNDLSARRAARVAELLRSFSAPTAAITILPFGDHAPVDHLPNASARSGSRRVEVGISGTEVVLPGCPDWSRDPGSDPNNLQLSNLGCANAYNLGLMIANPSDLAYPGPLMASDGTREAEAIVRYRSDKVKSLHVDVLQ